MCPDTGSRVKQLRRRGPGALAEFAIGAWSASGLACLRVPAAADSGAGRVSVAHIVEHPHLDPLSVHASRGKVGFGVLAPLGGVVLGKRVVQFLDDPINDTIRASAAASKTTGRRSRPTHTRASARPGLEKISQPFEFQRLTFSLRGGTTTPHLVSTSNFALAVFAPRPHVPHGLTPLRTTTGTTNETGPALRSFTDRIVGT